MVVCTLHLVSLHPGTPPARFLHTLRQHGAAPVFQARVLRWMVLPSHLSAGHLLARNTRWDLLLALPAEQGPSRNGIIPPPCLADVAAQWTVSCGVSGAALAGFRQLNESLFAAAGDAGPPPDAAAVLLAGPGDSDGDGDGDDDGAGQKLALSSEWRAWIAGLPRAVRAHPVSMLNLLAFAPGKKEQYKQYGAEFARRVGSRHGGRVKLVGRVLDLDDDESGLDGGRQGRARAGPGGWDEIAYVHYPSIVHFAAMAGSKDYQEVNERYRLGALRDTFILCCQEIGEDGELVAAARSKL